MSAEVDMIQKLFEVESESAQLVREAQKKADERIAQARAQAETAFKEAYVKVAAAIEAEEEQFKQDCRTAHEQAIDSYRAELSSAKRDVPAFEQLVQQLLYA